MLDKDMRNAQPRQREGRRRRRHSGHANPRAQILNIISAERTPRIGVALIALIYSILVIGQFRTDSVMLGFRPLNASEAQVLYGFGSPTSKTRNVPPDIRALDSSISEVWEYRESSGGIFQFGFGEDNLVKVVSCQDNTQNALSCPKAFGTGIGDTEDKTAYFLGGASKESINNNVKAILFEDVGLQYRLEKYHINKVYITSKKGSLFFRFLRLIRFMLP